jgi:tRNA G18 (ribose-2'-O)-methylase SpoU
MSARELTFGMHAVRHLLKAAPQRVRSLHVQSGRKDEPMRSLLELARAAHTPVHVVARSELDRMLPGARHQGAIADIVTAEALDEQALMSLIESCREAPLIIVLDGVQDPHNLGAVLRLADAAGVHAAWRRAITRWIDARRAASVQLKRCALPVTTRTHARADARTGHTGDQHDSTRSDALR